MRAKHESIYRIFVGIPIPLIILFIPVAVRLLTSPKYIFALSLTAAGELFLIIFFVIRGIILRNCSAFAVNEREITYRKGFLNRKLCKTKTASVTYFEFQQSVLQAVFGVNKLDIHSPFSKPSTVFLSKKDSVRLKEFLHFKPISASDYSFSVSLFRVILMSVTGSNAIAGFFIILPILRSAVVDVFNTFANTVEMLPIRNRVLTVITSFFLLGWLISSIDKLVRFFSFRIWKCGNRIFSSGGMFFRYIRQIDAKKIYAIDIRETLLSIILGMSVVYSILPGCNHQKSRKLAFLPCTGLKELNRTLRTFFPYSQDVICTLTTPKKYRLNHFVVSFNTIWITAVIGFKIGDSVGIFATLIIIICLWDILVSYFAMKRSGVKICSDCVIICAKRFFTLHTQKISREKIDSVTITRNPFEKINGLCSVSIRIKGCKSEIRCRHLPFERAYYATSHL